MVLRYFKRIVRSFISWYEYFKLLEFLKQCPLNRPPADVDTKVGVQDEAPEAEWFDASKS